MNRASRVTGAGIRRLGLDVGYSAIRTVSLSSQALGRGRGRPLRRSSGPISTRARSSFVIGHLDLPLADDPRLLVHHPDVVVAVLLEDGRLGDEQVRLGWRRRSARVLSGRKWTVAASSGNSLSSGSRISTFTLTVPRVRSPIGDDLAELAPDTACSGTALTETSAGWPTAIRDIRFSEMSVSTSMLLEVGDRHHRRPAQRRAHRHRVDHLADLALLLDDRAVERGVEVHLVLDRVLRSR